MPYVAGYRVLRSLARGRRAELIIGFDEGETVVVKRLGGQVEPADAARELEALSRAAGEHVVELLDVGSEDDATCLVLQRLAGPTLAAVLVARGRLEAGELVTILVPLARTVSRLHAAGVAHGTVDPSAIVFDESGSPTLVGFGAALLFAPGSPEVVLERVPGVAADREALRRLALELLHRAEPSAQVGQLVDRVRRAPPDELGEVLEHGLFELAPAEPVRLEGDPEAHLEPNFESRAFRFADEPFPAPDPDEKDERMPGPLDALLARAGAAFDGDLARAVRTTLGTRWTALDQRRRRILVGAAAGVATVLVVVAATPGPSGPPPAMPEPTAGSPAASVEPPLPQPAVASAAITGDDPVAAAVALLTLREECLRTASLLCLESVVQPGSAAAAADRELVAAIQAGGERPASVSAGAPELVERLGDSALVGLGRADGDGPETAPASLLLMKGEAGWRVRDYLPAHPEPGSGG